MDDSSANSPNVPAIRGISVHIATARLGSVDIVYVGNVPIAIKSTLSYIELCQFNS